jgi:RNA polymerase sigma factor (sigma-70 family)
MEQKLDSELVEEILQGNNLSFNQLVKRYQERIYWTARRIVNSHEDADDVVQNVFLKMYEGLKNFRGDSNLFTWLYRITVNDSLNRLRKKRFLQFVPYEEYFEDKSQTSESADDKVIRQEYQTALERAIEKLPPKQRTVFTMRYFNETPFEELANVLNKSVGGTKANYFQAVKKISGIMRKELTS